jgi:hypothetical protein
MASRCVLQAVMKWAGVALEAAEVQRLESRIGAMIDNAGTAEERLARIGHCGGLIPPARNGSRHDPD